MAHVSSLNIPRFHYLRTTPLLQHSLKDSRQGKNASTLREAKSKGGYLKEQDENRQSLQMIVKVKRTFKLNVEATGSGERDGGEAGRVGRKLRRHQARFKQEGDLIGGDIQRERCAANGSMRMRCCEPRKSSSPTRLQ